MRVYDWDFFSADDLIGQADVPLNGLLEYGQVEVELTLDLPDTSKKKVRGKFPKKTVDAGRLSGQILFEGRTPEYNQLGGLVERKPGVWKWSTVKDMHNVWARTVVWLERHDVEHDGCTFNAVDLGDFYEEADAAARARAPANKARAAERDALLPKGAGRDAQDVQARAPQLLR